LRIRPYAAADLDALIALFRDTVRTVARRDYSPEQLLAWAPDEVDRGGWALRLAASSTWVAAHDDRAVGFISLAPDGHIDMLYVDAALQGRGTASALLERLERAAWAQGLGRLFTEASITARPFFARRGFHVIEAQTVARHGQQLTNFRMARRLP
jgi:putative acetyltransferase